MDAGLIASVQPLSEQIAEVSGGARFNALLVASFAAISLVLAVIGVYGMLSYMVTQRTQEIGVRLALGSKRSQIFGLVLREGMAPVVVGVGICIVVVLALTRYLQSILYGVSATNLLTFVYVTTGLTLAAVIAMCIPARRASSVDPATALRHS